MDILYQLMPAWAPASFEGAGLHLQKRWARLPLVGLNQSGAGHTGLGGGCLVHSWLVGDCSLSWVL